MSITAVVCGVRSNPDREIIEVEVPLAEAQKKIEFLTRKGWETVFIMRTFRAFNPSRRKG